MNSLVSLRAVEAHDLPIFFAHQLDAEATRLAAFPSREREAFFTHWTTRVLANPDNASRTVVFDGRVAGYLGAWTDPDTRERLVGYWFGREFWGRGIASAAVTKFLQYETTRPLTARVARHNLGSIRVLEKSGFIRSGDDAFAPTCSSPGKEFIYVLLA